MGFIVIFSYIYTYTHMHFDHICPPYHLLSLTIDSLPLPGSCLSPSLARISFQDMGSLPAAVLLKKMSPLP